jgi:hypothetical protein
MSNLDDEPNLSRYSIWRPSVEMGGPSKIPMPFSCSKLKARSSKLSHSSTFPRVSGNCVAVSIDRKNAAEHKKNAQLNPLAWPTRPIT